MPLREDMLLHEDQGHHWQGVIANINGERFVDAMLDACTGRGPHVRHIKDIADLMGRHRWSITAGLHAGGLGGGGRAPDPNPHITLSIDGQRTAFHVHYRTHGGFLITGITP